MKPARWTPTDAAAMLHSNRTRRTGQTPAEYASAIEHHTVGGQAAISRAIWAGITVILAVLALVHLASRYSA